MARACPRLVCAYRAPVGPIGQPANAVSAANWDKRLRLDVDVFSRADLDLIVKRKLLNRVL